MSISRRTSSNGIAGQVDTYAQLPTASQHTGQVWLCRESSGVLWAYRKGLYLSDGSSWSRLSNVTLKTEYIDSSLQSAPDHARGRMFYDLTEETYTIYNDQTGVSLQIGRESWVRVYNDSGSTIPNGTVVYPTGVSGGIPTIGIARPDIFEKSRPLGMVTQDIEDSAQGEVTTYGKVRGIDTSHLSTGVVYLDEAGATTSTAPSGSDFIVMVGVCLVSDASDGVIFVHPVIGQTAVEVVDTNGFPNRTDTQISFDDVTRTFTIAPTSNNYHYYIEGRSYFVDESNAVQIPDEEGMYGFYYDGDTLTYAKNPTAAQIDSIILTMAFVAYVYWDATNSEAIYFGDERHGISMSPASHNYHHFSDGMRYLYGLALNGILPDESGDDDTHAQFGSESGMTTDEDIPHVYSSVASTTGLPIYYLEGATPYMRRVTESGFSVYVDGSVSGRPFFNELSGGVWGLTEVSNNYYFLMHVFAINSHSSEPGIIAVMGQNQYLTVAAARTAAETEISTILSLFPFEEIRAIGTVLYQTSSTYTNSVKTRIRSTGDGGSYVDWRVSPLKAGSPVSDHSALANRDIAGNHAKLIPALNGTTAIQITKADGTTVVVNVDTTNGRAGIGTTSPASVLDVNGGVKVANDTDSAAAGKVGTLRYRVSGSVAYVEICMQTGASLYQWVAIKVIDWNTTEGILAQSPSR